MAGLSGTVREPVANSRQRRNAARVKTPRVLSGQIATTTTPGSVKQAADTGVLTDNSGGTSGSGTIASIDAAITDPGVPADAAALRTDLVNNTIPDIEASLVAIANAVATLAEEVTAIRNNLRTAGTMA